MDIILNPEHTVWNKHLNSRTTKLKVQIQIWMNVISMKLVQTPARRKISTDITSSISSASSANKTRADLVVILQVEKNFEE